MKKSVTFIPTVRVSVLAYCSAVVLLTACGGQGDTASTAQAQTAALGYNSDATEAGASVAGADDSVVANSNAPAAEAVPADASATGNAPRLLAMSTAVSVDANANATTAGKNLYVATTGSDSNPGTQAAPLKTIARADALASPGYTIHVAAGTYKVSAPALGSAGIKTTRSGTATARIKFVSDVKWGAKLVVSGTGITWDSRGNYVDIDGFDITGTGRHGILAGGANLTITNNSIHDLTISGGCNGSGGAAIDTYGPVGNILVDRNVVKNIGYKMIGACNTVQGIYIANANVVVTNNIVSGVAAVAIQQWHAATASTIVNNTVFHSKDGILLAQGDAGATAAGSANNYVANNIVYDNTTYGILEGTKIGGNNRYANNLVASSGQGWKVKGAVSGSISSNPLFVNYKADGSGDYRVTSSSPAIDRGTSVSAPKVDVVLAARPRGAAVDVGAYEY